MAKKRIVTLLTDFGTRDGYAASMKGVLLSSPADVTVVDITHEIPPGDVLAGAFVLNQVLDYFPPGTVHMAVVDPGAGTDRRILAARYARQTIVAPDNGLVSLVDAEHPLEGIVSVRNESYFLRTRVGRTFDGRDMMAPVAAMLAGGAALDPFGPRPDTYQLLDLPAPHCDGAAVVGQVLYIDNFGSCISNISRRALEGYLPRADDLIVWVAGRPAGPLRGAFGHVASGQPVAFFDSLDMLELAVNEGRACDVFGLTVGDEVQVRCRDKVLPAGAGPAETQ